MTKYDKGLKPYTRRVKIKAVAMTTKIQRYFYKGVTFYQSFKISP